jgi:hypothetical protein
MATQTYVNGVTLSDATEFNNFDSVAYSVLSSVTGTNSLTATGPANYTYAATRPPVWFIPGFTNTSTVTLNITPSGGAALGAKNVFYNGAPCISGELASTAPVAALYDGTQFNIISMSHPKFTNAISTDIALSTTGAYFTGPSVAQGPYGTWFASGTVSVIDTAAAAMLARLWDGTTTAASAVSYVQVANQTVAISLSGYFTSPTGNIRISVRDSSTTNGTILFNGSGLSTDSVISVFRIG